MDSYLDIYSMGAREYDPSLGRWLSADTIIPETSSPQNWNRYAYVRNNPVGYSDPSGHIPVGAPLIDGLYSVGRRKEESRSREATVDKGADSSRSALARGLSSDDPIIPPPDAVGFRFDASGSLSAIGGDQLTAAATAASGEFAPIVGPTVFAITHIGLDVNVDVVINLNDQETGQQISFADACLREENVGLYFTLNGQFLTEGAGVSAGPLAIWNLPTNDDLVGWSGSVEGSWKTPIGLEGNLFYQPTEDGPPVIGIYVAPGGGGEVTAGLGAGYTWDITKLVFEDILGF